jgi:hypothetical protein
MIASADRWAACRCVLPVLIVLLVLGHACELPAYADVLASSQMGGEPHHSADGHPAGDQAISCDAIGVSSNAGHPQAGGALEIWVVLEAVDPAPARMVARSFEGPANPAVRPPLFLLHASFLI